MRGPFSSVCNMHTLQIIYPIFDADFLSLDHAADYFMHVLMGTIQRIAPEDKRKEARVLPWVSAEPLAAPACHKQQ